MKMSNSWSNWFYSIKKIWFDHSAGSAAGAYHFYAITTREKDKDAPLHHPDDARLFYVSFTPDQKRKDLHIRQVGKQPPVQLLTMLKAFIELVIDHPQDWLQGNKPRHYVYYPNLGTFYLRQVPCLVLPEHRPLFELSREDFTKQVDANHAFIRSILILDKSA